MPVTAVGNWVVLLFCRASRRNQILRMTALCLMSGLVPDLGLPPLTRVMGRRGRGAGQGGRREGAVWGWGGG